MEIGIIDIVSCKGFRVGDILGKCTYLLESSDKGNDVLGQFGQVAEVIVCVKICDVRECIFGLNISETRNLGL